MPEYNSSRVMITSTEQSLQIAHVVFVFTYYKSILNLVLKTCMENDCLRDLDADERTLLICMLQGKCECVN
jgi:hypothetical protein